MNTHLHKLPSVLIPLLCVNAFLCLLQDGIAEGGLPTTDAHLGSNIALSSHLTGANAIPPNQSPLEGYAALSLGNPYHQAGVSNVLTVSVEAGFLNTMSTAVLEPG